MTKHNCPTDMHFDEEKGMCVQNETSESVSDRDVSADNLNFKRRVVKN